MGSEMCIRDSSKGKLASVTSDQEQELVSESVMVPLDWTSPQEMILKQGKEAVNFADDPLA